MDTPVSNSAMAAGILHPKLRHHFMVRFSAVLDREHTHVHHPEMLLAALSMQLTECELPTEVLNEPLPVGYKAQTVDGFRIMNHIGSLMFTFEDDADNRVSRAIQMISHGAHVNALICLMSGSEKITEAFFAKNIKPLRLERSSLSYNPSHGSLRGKITLPEHDHVQYEGHRRRTIMESDSIGITADIHSASDGSSAMHLKLIASPAVMQHRVFNADVDMEDLVSQTLGV